MNWKQTACNKWQKGDDCIFESRGNFTFPYEKWRRVGGDLIRIGGIKQ